MNAREEPRTAKTAVLATGWPIGKRRKNRDFGNGSSVKNSADGGYVVSFALRAPYLSADIYLKYIRLG